MESQQFIYVLKLIPQLLNEKNWTERDNRVIETHFNYLRNLLAEKRLIMAGRTLTIDESTFGVVILCAADETEARELMSNDPAVKNKLMTATLFPFRVALM